MNIHLLVDLLRPLRITEIVDIGANPIDGNPPYLPMLKAGNFCRLTGFEPQDFALRKLNKIKSNQERYFPYAVGDGQPKVLNICSADGMTSTLKPNKSILQIFRPFDSWGEIVYQEKISTRTLDSISEIEHLDFLKIDIQGGELSVFENGKKKLADTVLIHTEVSFISIYEGQPTFGTIDNKLRSLGFIPHCFYEIKNWIISPLVINNNPRIPLNQVIEADVVYVKDFTQPELISSEQLKHLALIAHICYQSFDLAMRCIMVLEERGDLPGGSVVQYHSILA